MVSPATVMPGSVERTGGSARICRLRPGVPAACATPGTSPTRPLAASVANAAEAIHRQLLLHSWWPADLVGWAVIGTPVLEVSCRPVSAMHGLGVRNTPPGCPRYPTLIIWAPDSSNRTIAP